ncbi:hypothetical protein O6P43_012039 [Quillaja saponaria]|uniref:Uncharacterized protein n=1 Tax=Quillaja saponaria TaxID=32244 RepID=A0AAD7M1A3_QUISA|nr:hypothetical protein O6P43_012039 [Quillaja saponaria]
MLPFVSYMMVEEEEADQQPCELPLDGGEKLGGDSGCGGIIGVSSGRNLVCGGGDCQGNGGKCGIGGGCHENGSNCGSGGNVGSCGI